MKFACVFPGQGSQSKGMMDRLAEDFPIVGETFAEASDTLGYDLWALVSKDANEQLNQTEFTQPAMLASGVATWRVFCEMSDLRPSVMAGHSLGEYSALVASNALDFSSAVSIVAERARLMQAAVPAGEGAMAAILGLDDADVVAVCEAAEGVVEAVNFNSPGQVVIAGAAAAVDAAIEIAQEKGAKRALKLPVSVPSHSSLMIGAAEQLSEKLSAADIQLPSIPVIHNVNAQAATDVANMRELLAKQLHSPVMWVDSVRAMQAQGAEAIVESGPGKVLAGLTKRIERKLPAQVLLANRETMQKAIDAIA